MRLTVHEAIAGVAPGAWNTLVGDGFPFLRHEFLLAAEQTGCVAEDAGWAPRHLALEHRGRLLGAMPLYQKQHSWGEFVFDWAWARAYERAGLPYYPKMVSAIPFTPAPGRRLLLAKDAGVETVRALLDGAIDLAPSPVEAAQREVGLDRLVIDPHHLEKMFQRLVGLLIEQEIQTLEIVDVKRRRCLLLIALTEATHRPPGCREQQEQSGEQEEKIILSGRCGSLHFPGSLHALWVTGFPDGRVPAIPAGTAAMGSLSRHPGLRIASGDFCALAASGRSEGMRYSVAYTVGTSTMVRTVPNERPAMLILGKECG